MGDIISRIKLETVGAEQASREIRKLKRAFDETSSASKGIGLNGIGGDPFSKATLPPSGYLGGSSELDSHSKYHREWLQQQNSKPSGLGLANTASSMITQTSQGNMLGAVGTGISALGRGVAGLGAGAMIAGGVLAVGAVAIKTIGALASKEEQRIGQLFSSGISQRLGGYDKTWTAGIEMARNGIPLEMIPNYLNSVSSMGGNLIDEGNLNEVNRGAQASVSMGLNSSVVGSLIGTTQMLKMNTMDNDFYKRLKGTFGKFGSPSMDASIGALQQYMQSQMSGGATTNEMSADMFNAHNTQMQAYVQYGGLTSAGAIQATQQATSRAQRASGLGSAEDVIALQAIMRKKGLSLTDAQIYMENHPEEVNKAMYESIDQRGGSEAQKLRMAQRWLGGDMRSARNFMQTQGDLATLGENGLPKADDVTTFQKGQDQQSILRAKNWSMFAKAEKEALNFTTKMKEMLYGIDDRPIDARTASVVAKGDVYVMGVGNDMFSADRTAGNETLEKAKVGYLQNISNPKNKAKAEAEMNTIIDNAGKVIRYEDMGKYLGQILNILQEYQNAPEVDQPLGSTWNGSVKPRD